MFRIARNFRGFPAAGRPTTRLGTTKHAGGTEGAPWLVRDADMYLQVRDGHITRIEEYLDSAKRSSIKAAREALSG